MRGYSAESATARWHDETPLRLAVSACLLGRRVRWDGGHKRDARLCDELAPHLAWVPLCPEMELGLGAPRDPLRLVVAPAAPRLVQPASGRDLGDAMRRYGRTAAEALATDRVCGAILKSRSPSCGRSGIPVYEAGGAVVGDDAGVFAAALAAALPGLPIEDEAGLCDPERRGAFLERLFAVHRLDSLFASPWTAADLVGFHAAHKLQLMAHAPEGLRRLGAVVAEAGVLECDDLRERYREGFCEALATAPSRGRHVNVLEHMAGYFRGRAEADSRAQLRRAIEAFAAGAGSLAALRETLRRDARAAGLAYLSGQVYLEPLPRALVPEEPGRRAD